MEPWKNPLPPNGTLPTLARIATFLYPLALNLSTSCSSKIPKKDNIYWVKNAYLLVVFVDFGGIDDER